MQIDVPLSVPRRYKTFRRDNEGPAAPIKKATKEVFVKIGSMDVLVKEIEGPIVIVKAAQSIMKRAPFSVTANDHEIGSSKSVSKYFQLKCCPKGLTTRRNNTNFNVLDARK